MPRDTTTNLNCWNCGTSLDEVPQPISRHEHCPKCFEALHSCRLCRNYRTDVTGECTDERADPPVNKENANFCEFFVPAAGGGTDDRSARNRSALDRLDSLFSKD